MRDVLEHDGFLFKVSFCDDPDDSDLLACKWEIYTEDPQVPQFTMVLDGPALGALIATLTKYSTEMGFIAQWKAMSKFHSLNGGD